jgi:multidrug efflux pump subunit AcrA (membrane-fusion protein)
MLQPFTKENEVSFLNKYSKKSFLIYWIILSIIITALAALPFIYFDISVKSSGIIRPSMERTEIKSMQPGIIDSVFYKEGNLVAKDSVVDRLDI